MATITLNNWKDSLPLGVAIHAKLINEDQDKFAVNITTYTIKQVNGFLLYYILFYQDRYYTNLQLWKYFREDFIGWTADTWALSNVNIIQDFQDFLCRNRVYITKNSNLIISNIQAVIIGIEELVWTEAKIIC